MIFNTAYAQAAGEAPAGSLFAQMLPLVILVVIFYFLLIRPQQKRNKEHREMLAAIAVGDEVVTGGGIMGKIVEVQEHYVTLDLGDSKVRFQKNALQAVLPKGTL